MFKANETKAILTASPISVIKTKSKGGILGDGNL